MKKLTKITRVELRNEIGKLQVAIMSMSKLKGDFEKRYPEWEHINRAIRLSSDKLNESRMWLKEARSYTDFDI